ncbi:ATP-binding protein [Nereida sp. NH-UV-3]|uniref:sensor histidine kinase NtrY-like n=1 Tax=Nereida TaxID=282198 RepID=UPI0036F31BF9
MRLRADRRFWDRLSRFYRRRSTRSAFTVLVVALGPILAIATFTVLGPLQDQAVGNSLRLVLLADLVYALVVATMVASRVAQMIAARRAKSAGSRLHLRLTGVFALVALLPTILVAIFAGLTVNVGLEGWFSDRVRGVVGASLTAAQAYETEQREDLIRDAQILARFLNVSQRDGVLSDAELRLVLGQVQPTIQNPLAEAFIIDGNAEIRARGAGSYLFNYEEPAEQFFGEARDNGVAVIEDWGRDEFRALVPLANSLDRFVYISREVDGAILQLLDDTQQSAKLYQQLEQDRGRLLFEFGLLYLGFAVILILAAIWLGLWFAERLARPVGRLAGAARRVGMGDLDVVVREERGDDEISMLSRYFNQMTRQLKQQRDTLLDSTRQIERRRRLFDSVLSSVTSGVVGLDAGGHVSFVNKSAERLLRLDPDLEARVISEAVPEFEQLFDDVTANNNKVVQAEVKVTRNGVMESLLVRIAPRIGSDGTEGYVISFDDVTDLVSAQRMAAWGDVARRIAHEIKNPLTPIQLSAERIKRKFGREVEDAEALEQMTGVIVRQTGDLRRIVDEFSKFARMPEPQRREEDLSQILRDAVTLQSASGLKITADIPQVPIWADIDSTMVGQALTNLIKNASEAIESYEEKFGVRPRNPEVSVSLTTVDHAVQIMISDNGIGLPVDRSKLFEPYVTTRDKGTGLGLPIVKKIIEEHGGSLSLEDAEPMGGNTHSGASAIVTLPISPMKNQIK